MDGGLTYFAILLIKLSAALGLSTGLITGVKYFNTYDPKGKKKGGARGGSDDLDYLREKVRPRD
jgi:hypothetical protein